jgi:hypothetical protein
MEMALRNMEVDGGLFQIVVTQEDLNGTQIGAGLQQMCGETVPQGMRMNGFP